MEINKITFANKGSYAIAGAVGNLAFSTISYGLPTANKSVSEAATAHSLNVGNHMKNKRRNIKKNRLSIFLPILTIVGIGIITVISSSYEKSWTYNWNGIRENIRDSIKVADFEGMTSGVVGVSGRSTMHEVIRRRKIMHDATESELLRLTEYPSGTVKAIAYEGLIRKKDFKQKTEIILKAFQDREYLVSYQMGCEGMNMEIGKYLMTFVLNYNEPFYPSSREENNFGISELDKEKILTEYRKLIN